MRNMTEEFAHKVYDVLVEECGASADPDARGDFAYHQSSDTDFKGHEYRFMGALGFGGKFWTVPRMTNFPGWYVNCYSEDETPKRRAMIERANKRLDVLEQEYLAQEGA